MKKFADLIMIGKRLKDWPLDGVGKDPDAGKDWGPEEKWAIEDEMVG